MERVSGATHELMRQWIDAHPRGTHDVPSLRRSAGAGLWERCVHATSSTRAAVIKHAEEVLRITARVRS